MAAGRDGFGAERAADPSEQAQLLLEINNAVVSHLELAPLLRAVSGCLRRAMPHDFAGLAMYDPEAGHLRVHGLNFPEGHPYFVEGQIIPVEGTPGGLAVKTGRPVLRHRPDPEEFPAEVMKQALALGIKSGIVVPMIRHGETLGTLVISSFEESKYTEADVELLTKIAAQVAISVQNLKNYEAMRQAQKEAARERDRSQLLLQVNNAVITHLNLSDLLKAVSERLNALLPHDSTFIALRESDGIHLQTKAQFLGKLQNVKFTEGLLVPMAGTPEERVIQTGKPVLITKVSELENFPSPWVRHALDVGIKSGCSVPLIWGGEILGVLGITSLQEESFRPEDVALLEQCATQVAIAVENAVNFEKARAAERGAERERDRSDLLLEINNTLVSNLELDELVKGISRSLQHLIQHDCVGLAIYDAESGKMFAQAVSSDLEPMLEGIYYAPEGTVSGATFSSGEPTYVWPLSSDRFSSATTKGFIDKGLKTLYAVPLVVHGRKIGVMSISSVRDDAFTKEDQHLFRQIGKQVALAAANSLAVRDLEQLKNKLAQEKLYLEDEIRTEFNFDEIIGQSPALRQVLQMVETVAPSDSTVLLLGETGTGKELIARAVHNHSRRKNRTFVKMNCAAIPTGLLESELFGHERGAFTGAIAQKIGRLELADQGTLFLDEVGDIPVEIQPKLLRALQEREFERLGSTVTKKVNVRLVAATNRDLEKMIADREFRSDLYYRLNVFPIRIPPLRERSGDIPLLVRYFAQKCARQMQKNIETIPADAIARLQAWHWPGNVRELENVIERAVILTSGTALQVPMTEVASTTAPAETAEASTTLAGTERDYIVKILRETRGVLAGPNGAASRLGVKRTTLQYKMKKLGITREHWWPSSPS
jgi:formate hydrogenlyase transcriptional activator